MRRDHWTCQGCFYRPAQAGRDWIAVHHRGPGVSRPALLISLCAACHATIERLQAVRVWLPPQLRILWREQHRGAAYQLPLPLSLPIEPERAAGALVAVAFNPKFNPKIVELDV
ncbi:MAG: hypothetical protein WCA20_32695 [Candidatus Sulfotelmatobacter sp.]